MAEVAGLLRLSAWCGCRAGVADRALLRHLPRWHRPYQNIRCECPIHAAGTAWLGHPRRINRRGSGRQVGSPATTATAITPHTPSPEGRPRPDPAPEGRAHGGPRPRKAGHGRPRQSWQKARNPELSCAHQVTPTGSQSVRFPGSPCPPERIIRMHVHTYVTELALAAEPSKLGKAQQGGARQALQRRHVICAGVVDDRTRDG
jgi:hypothetical protein